MTRERILQLLGLVVLQMANKLPVPQAGQTVDQVVHGQPAISEQEWAYVVGLASAAVLQLHERLTAAGR